MNDKSNRILVALLIVTLVISQSFLFNKIEGLENQNMNLQNLLYGVQSAINQQNYMITTEKADYMLQSVACEKVIVNEKTDILNLNLMVEFSKLPTDAIVSLDYRGTTNHYPASSMDGMYATYEPVKPLTYGKLQSIVLNQETSNVLSAALELDLGQNYEFSVVIESINGTFRETLGIIPALEWRDPKYRVAAQLQEAGVKTPDNGYFKFTARVEIPNYFVDEYGMDYGKVLYTFQDFENNISLKLTSVVYTVYYKDEVIDQGEMAYIDRSAPERPVWEISDVSKFKANMEADYISELRVVFEMTDENGKVTETTWWADGTIQ